MEFSHQHEFSCYISYFKFNNSFKYQGFSLLFGLTSMQKPNEQYSKIVELGYNYWLPCFFIWIILEVMRLLVHLVRYQRADQSCIIEYLSMFSGDIYWKRGLRSVQNISSIFEIVFLQKIRLQRRHSDTRRNMISSGI